MLILPQNERNNFFIKQNILRSHPYLHENYPRRTTNNGKCFIQNRKSNLQKYENWASKEKNTRTFQNVLTFYSPSQNEWIKHNFFFVSILMCNLTSNTIAEWMKKLVIQWRDRYIRWDKLRYLRSCLCGKLSEDIKSE